MHQHYKLNKSRIKKKTISICKSGDYLKYNLKLCDSKQNAKESNERKD